MALAATWYDKAKDQAEQAIADGINEDYNKISDGFSTRHQGPGGRDTRFPVPVDGPCQPVKARPVRRIP
jgi:hypothetical protein